MAAGNLGGSESGDGGGENAWRKESGGKTKRSRGEASWHMAAHHRKNETEKRRNKRQRYGNMRT